MKKDRLSLITPLVHFLDRNAEEYGIIGPAFFVNDCLMRAGVNVDKDFFAKWDKAFFDFYSSRFHHADNFTAELFRLFYKADVRNQIRFLKGFPIEMAVFQAWRENGSDAEFFREFINK